MPETLLEENTMENGPCKAVCTAVAVNPESTELRRNCPAALQSLRTVRNGFHLKDQKLYESRVSL